MLADLTNAVLILFVLIMGSPGTAIVDHVNKQTLNLSLTLI